MHPSEHEQRMIDQKSGAEMDRAQQRRGAITLQEGDIYRWSYKEPGDDRAWGRYHCCSQIAIVRNGRLKDTYWYGNDGRSFAVDDLPKLNLTRIANLSDLDQAKEYQADYYNDTDIVDLNHSNSPAGNFYLRKGAKRSADKMHAAARRKLEKAESDEKMAQWKAEQLRAAIRLIESGQHEAVML